jgi:hypothetical protein
MAIPSCRVYQYSKTVISTHRTAKTGKKSTKPAMMKTSTVKRHVRTMHLVNAETMLTKGFAVVATSMGVLDRVSSNLRHHVNTDSTWSITKGRGERSR